MPKVSIVLPAYNGEKYIRESIESILCQTLTDWELIIVNDCSTDSTPLIIKEYAARDDRIKVVTNLQNQKLPESLNIGFRQAHGEYLTWTSDDNMYKPQALEIMAGYLDKNIDCPMVCTAMDIIDPEGMITGCKDSYDDYYMLYNNCVGASFLYRNNVRKIVGEYDKDSFLVEDYDYWLRIIFNYGKIDFLNKNLYKYRVHQLSLTGQKKLQINVQLMKLRKKYLDNIIDICACEKYILCAIFCDFMLSGCLDDNIRYKLQKMVPELQIIKAGKPSGRIVVYGAGNIGAKAYKEYKEKILYYIDKNYLKIKYCNNIKIISSNSLSDMQGKFDIVIAVSTEKIYDILTQISKVKRDVFLYEDISG